MAQAAPEPDGKIDEAVLAAGTGSTTVRRYTVKVVDGQFNLRFTPRVGAVLIDTIRVTERPDVPTP
ncbi:hypothetical protein Ssi02_48880 [Sinosporangium siamense]|uniref:Uncharacterized protein n=1 Tax=Sinosporangium siamense TaxID=1367973 RepID=A0A919RIX5_9ACTN|nr:hypothetical protein Ssi02_48880 [Sinosporangium siamense]